MTAVEWLVEEFEKELKVGDSTNFGIITDIKEYSVCFGKNKVGVDIWYKKSDVKVETKQERSYSEEDMKLAFEAGHKKGFSGYPNTENWKELSFKDWFEQFKNK